MSVGEPTRIPDAPPVTGGMYPGSNDPSHSRFSQLSYSRDIINTSTGPGNHFTGASFSGPVNILQEFGLRRRDAFCRDLKPPRYLDQKNSIDRRIEGTCQWCVNHPSFLEWKSRDTSKILWISADPGCGKSVLARYLVDDVLPNAQTSKGKKRIISYFFFKDGPLNQNNITVALQALLHQIFLEEGGLLKERNLEHYEKTGSTLLESFAQLWHILTCTADEQEDFEIVCVLDALDECKEEGREQFFAAIKQLCQSQMNIGLKFLVTSRPYVNIEVPFSDPSLRLIHLSGDSAAEKEDIKKEINLVIDKRVDELSRYLQTGEKALLLKKLKETENRTYLWVDIILKVIKKDVLAKQVDRSAIEKAIAKLPSTLYGAYEKILAKTEMPQKTKDMLQVVATAARPLTSKELRAALTLHDASWSTSKDEPEPDDRFDKTIRSISQLLLSVIDDKVHLLHRTVKEFLMKPDPEDADASYITSRITQPPTEEFDFKWKECISPAESHQLLADACIKTLRASQAEHKAGDANQTGFFDYSSQYWAFHIRKSSTILSRKSQKKMTKTILEICDPDSASFAAWFSRYWGGKNSTTPGGFTALMTLSYFGFTAALKRLLGIKRVDINARDTTYGRSALSWASEHGHEEVVQKLIRRVRSMKIWQNNLVRIQIDSPDRRGRTPLFYAVWSGSLVLVNSLLRKGAKVDRTDENAATPLLYASFIQKKDILNAMMDKNVEEKVLSDTIGRVLLSAAERGDEEAVSLLLRAEHVDLEVRDKTYDGHTPLMKAAQHGHRYVVEKLAREGADVTATDKFGDTALHLAVSEHRLVVVELLLQYSKSLMETKNYSGQTPLMEAAAGGSEYILKLLLKEGADVTASDNKGNTALHLAASGSRNIIVRLLLQHKKSLMEAQNNKGRTPLLEVATLGDIDMLQVLLEEGADVTASDKNGNTALHSAAQIPRTEVVELLLETKTFALEAKNLRGRTALTQAAEAGLEENVERLLKGGVNVGALDETGATALHWAAYNGHEQASSKLVNTDAIGINTKDRDGATPLDWLICGYSLTGHVHYAVRDHLKVAQILLESGAEVNFAYTLGTITRVFATSVWTAALRRAAQDKWKSLIDLLLNHSPDSNSEASSAESRRKLAQIREDASIIDRMQGRQDSL